MKTLNSDAATLVAARPASANDVKAKQAEIADAWTNLKAHVSKKSGSLIKEFLDFLDLGCVEEKEVERFK